MARRFDPLIEAVIDVISERAPDFDPEVIADLIEVVADDIWVSALGPAVDQVMNRIGLGDHIESSEPDIAGNVTLPSDPNLAGEPNLASAGVTMMAEPKVGKILSCPGCNRTVRSADGWCQHCGAAIGEHPNEGGP